MTLPLALKDCIRVKRGSAHWFYFVRSFYSGGVRYVIVFRRDYPDVHLQTREMNTREKSLRSLKERWIWDCCVTQRYGDA